MSAGSPPRDDALATALDLLGVRFASVYDAQRLPAGLSSAQLWRLVLRDQAPSGAPRVSWRIVKMFAPAGDWLAAASGDPGARELRLWAAGIAAALPHSVETSVLAHTAQRDPIDALLMRDVSAALLHDALRTPPGRLPRSVVRVMDTLAQLHARFWRDPRLRDVDLGLMSTRAALTLLAPEMIAARLRDGDTQPYLPLAAAGWQSFFALCAPQTAERLRGVFADSSPVVAAIDRLPFTLLHGDVWGPNLGWLPATRHAPRTGRRLLLLDWALAAAGPCTYDPLWLCGTWQALDPTHVLAVYRARLNRHLAARGVRLAPSVWRALVDAGYLRTTLTCGEALGRAVLEAPSGHPRQRAERRARWWAQRALAAAERLLSSGALA